MKSLRTTKKRKKQIRKPVKSKKPKKKIYKHRGSIEQHPSSRVSASDIQECPLTAEGIFREMAVSGFTSVRCTAKVVFLLVVLWTIQKIVKNTKTFSLIFIRTKCNVSEDK